MHASVESLESDLGDIKREVCEFTYQGTSIPGGLDRIVSAVEAVGSAVEGVKLAVGSVESAVSLLGAD